MPCQTGLFNIAPVPSNHCAPDLSGNNQVNYDVAQITFTLAGGQLIAAPGPNPASFGTLTDPAPACPSFTATAHVSGGSPEDYTLMGTFTDANHFTGSFLANYHGAGPIAGCQGGTPIQITGTRM
jgi:hypothetical protein